MAENKEIAGQPQPDPWAPPGANATQAASAGAGATGVLLMLGDQPADGVFTPEVMAWIPDPNQIFAGVAHVLGFDFNRLDAFSWGFVLVVLSVLLSFYSLWLRYRYAQQVEREYAAQQAAKAAKEDSVQRQAKAQGFVGGDA